MKLDSNRPHNMKCQNKAITNSNLEGQGFVRDITNDCYKYI